MENWLVLLVLFPVLVELVILIRLFLFLIYLVNAHAIKIVHVYTPASIKREKYKKQLIGSYMG